jgi:glycosyltransferase involved in cell wall biosynthesis
VTDRIFANSQAVKRFAVEYERIPADRFEVIYHGIDPEAFKSNAEHRDKIRQDFGLSDGDYVIGTVGRLAEQKGHRYLLDAAAIVCARCRNAKFVIVGGDARRPSESIKEQLLRLNRSLNGHDKAIFTGLRTDIPDVMSLFDIFVLPSLWEGFGIVLIEAMSLRKPIIATNVDGIPEVVVDGVTGLLVPPRDANALANAILELIRDQSRAREMGERGRLRVEEHFTADRMVKRYEQAYESILIHKRLRVS